MTVVGLGPEKQNTILQLVSAILQIGNISFSEKQNVAYPDQEKSKYFVHSVQIFISRQGFPMLQ